MTLRVLFLLDSLSPGGTETSTVQLAGALRARGVEPTIAILRVGDHDLVEAVTALGVRVRVLGARRWLGRVREVRRLLAELEPDVLHTALFTSDQIGRVASFRHPVAVVSSFVSTPYDEGRRRDPNVRGWKLRIVRFVDTVTGRLFVDRFHSVSAGTAEANASALRVPLSKVTVVERGRNLDSLGVASEQRRDEVRSRLGLDPSEQVLLSIGRQDRQKAHVDLIAAINTLVATHPKVRLLIAGKEGNATTALREALTAHPGCRDRIQVLGHRTDIGDLLAASDALVISSHFEGTAGVAIEAMAVGVPVIATDIPGVRGVLDHGRNCLLAPPANPAALASRIGELLDDPGLAERLTRAGRTDVAERFTLDRSAENMAALYRDALAARTA